MSDKRYFILLDLFHEYNEAFVALPAEIQMEFHAKLQRRSVGVE